MGLLISDLFKFNIIYFFDSLTLNIQFGTIYHILITDIIFCLKEFGAIKKCLLFNKSILKENVKSVHIDDFILDYLVYFE